MANLIPLLALSPTMEEGTIVKWNFKEGEFVKKGDTLCEVETDKAAVSHPSYHEGQLLKILVSEGHSIPLETPIAILGKKGEDISALLSQSSENQDLSSQNSSIQNASSSPLKAEKLVQQPSEPISQTGRIRISPLARKIAQKKRS